MVSEHTVGMTSTEIAALWSTYINGSVEICLTTYFLKHQRDPDVTGLLNKSLENTRNNMSQIRDIFNAEHFPIPQGYSEQKDVNLSAPPLFFDLFPLSYVYGASKMGLMNYSVLVTSVAREDIRKLFSACVQSQLDLFNESVNLMLSKGIYDRPALIPYPDHVEFIKKKETFLSKWFESSRPLNVLELTDIFFNIERNFAGVILLTAFIQTVKDKDIQKYLIRGKQLAQKQIQFLNDLLTEEDLLGTIMMNTEVTTSTIAPFSDRLILGLITMANSAAITYIGHAISTASRVDLVVKYTEFLSEIVRYGKEGMDMLIEREWIEEPPHAPDRKALAGV